MTTLDASAAQSTASGPLSAAATDSDLWVTRIDANLLTRIVR